jgi:hypothetical protein
MITETKEERKKRQRRESMARARAANPTLCAAKRNAWYAANRERILAESREWYAKHGKMAIRTAKDNRTQKEKTADYNKAYSKKKKAEIRARRIERDKKNADSIYKAKAKRYAKDIKFWLASRLRARLIDALKIRGIKKNNRTMELVGCTTDHLRCHLESQFKLGMTWENRGYNGWHIDHIKPCASFDLSDTEQQRACFNWTNLQPMWAADNQSKGARFNGIDYKGKPRLMEIREEILTARK